MNEKVTSINGEPVETGVTSADILDKVKAGNFGTVVCIGVDGGGHALMTNVGDPRMMIAILEVAKAMVIENILSVEQS